MGGRRPADRDRRGVSERALSTRLIHSRGARLDPPTVNPPLERGSTVLFNDTDTLYSAKPSYGRMGLAVHRELEAALCELEGAHAARLAPNGLGACALAIASVVEAGDHVLITDSLYGPTRRFCERRLKAMGVSLNRFPPRIGAGITDLIRPETRAIVLESPGSLTFEVMDTPAIVEIARAHGIATVMDNTWSAGVYHKPLTLGVDLSAQALTKYAVGHADAFAGAVMSRDASLAAKVAACAEDWGISLAPEEAYTALRGLRTLPVRLERHQASALTVADWLAGRPEVAEVLHPALPGHRDHALWQRDFTGASGLFSVVLKPVPAPAVKAFLESLTLFSMGFSWGGYESLIIDCDPQLDRSPGDWTETKTGPLIRLHIGLEDSQDLIADLKAGLAHLT